MTIRKTLMLELVARLNTIPGWTAAIRKQESRVTGECCAFVHHTGEDKALANNSSYDATLRCEVTIVVQAEAADPVVDQGNSYLLLDRRIGEAENKVHDPDAWGAVPSFTDVSVTGHVVEDPSDANEQIGRLFVVFKYRHDYQDVSS